MGCIDDTGKLFDSYHFTKQQVKHLLLIVFRSVAKMKVRSGSRRVVGQIQEQADIVHGSVFLEI